MRTSCINHPVREPFVIIRRWQLKACSFKEKCEDGKEKNRIDMCAAALLSVFEYFHNIRVAQVEKSQQQNAVAEQYGEEGCQDVSFLQAHTNRDLRKYLLGLYAENRICESIGRLITIGFVRSSRNPNPRYSFDQTRHYLLDPEAVNDWIEENMAENTDTPENQVCIAEKSAMDRGKIRNVCTEEAVLDTPKKGKGVGKAKRGNGTGAETLEIPEALRTHKLLEAWASWLADRRDRGKRVTLRAGELQLRDLAAMGPDRAVAAIENSIMKGYQGIFENGHINGNHHSSRKGSFEENPRNRGVCKGVTDYGAVIRRREAEEMARFMAENPQPAPPTVAQNGAGGV